jgi:hypothetical protein
VNPASVGVKAKKNEIVGKISAFFADYPDIGHDVYVTRWKRDAVGYMFRESFFGDDAKRLFSLLFDANVHAIDLIFL